MFRLRFSDVVKLVCFIWQPMVLTTLAILTNPASTPASALPGAMGN